MSGKRIILSLLVLLIGLVILFLVLRHRIESRRAQSRKADQASDRALSAEHGALTGRRSTSSEAFKPSSSFPTRNLPLTPAQRLALLAAIQNARQRRTEASRTDETSLSARQSGKRSTKDGDSGHLDKDYIRERVREILPLIRECYELALDETPGTSGTIKVRFVMSGEPEIGGIIEESEVVEDTGVPSGSILKECVRESMFAMEFDPPAGGGRVTVTYPFTFSTNPNER